MSLFKNIFKSGAEAGKGTTSNVQWIPFTTLEQLEDLKTLSKEETILIFKHSTRCGISRMVLKSFEKKFDASMKDLKVYYLDLLNYRSVSDEAGYAFQVLHQSPQLLVIQNGVAVRHASHYDITTLDLSVYV